MKNTVIKAVLIVAGLALILGVVKLIGKIIAGAFGIVTGLLNTILAVAVVVALIAIVCWMFSYAAKKR